MHHETYFFTRSALIRIAAFVYFAAFLTAYNQNSALIGENGLLPADVYLDRISHQNQHKHPLSHRNKIIAQQINTGNSKNSKKNDPIFEMNMFMMMDDDDEDLPIARWCSISDTSIFYRDDIPDQKSSLSFN